MVTVYGKDGSQFRDKPEGIFKQRDLNSFVLDGEIDTSFEISATEVENACWPKLSQTIREEKLNAAEIEYISTYLAFSRLRNPNVQRGVVEMHRQSVKTTASLMDRAGRFDEIGPNPVNPEKRIPDLLEDGTLITNIDNSVYLNAIGGMIEKMANLLINGYRWCLIKSPRGRVIIGDHPLTYVHPGEDPGAYGMVPGGKGCEMAFPLSRNLYLFGKWEQEMEDFESEDAVDELNRRQAIFATRHIAGPISHRRWHSLARRYKDFGFETRAETLDYGSGSYQIVRSGVMRRMGVKNTKTKNPLLGTKPVAAPK